jgi:ceramide glucosyltransferase
MARLVEGGIHFGLGSTLACGAMRWRGRRTRSAGRSSRRRLRDGRAHRRRRLLDPPGYGGSRDQRPGLRSGRFWSHQLRWARTVRDSRRWGYAGLIFTHTLPLAVANVLASGASFWSIWLLGLAFFLRLGAAMQVGAGVLRRPAGAANLWLLPLRDAGRLSRLGVEFCREYD